jgi:hypothetical protein
VLTVPRTAVGSRLDDALALWDLTGRRLYRWQEIDLEAILAVDEVDDWAASESGLLVSRQQGKGDILQVFDLSHLFLWPKSDGEPKVILHTGHEFANIETHYRKLRRRVLSTPWMRRQLLGGGKESSRGYSGITTGMGKRVFELENGNLLILQTRTGSAGVGATVDVLVVDEAQESSAEAMEALLFTQAAARNSVALYAGTVPTPTQDGAHFEALRNRGRAGTYPRTTWIEHSPEGSDDPNLAELIPSDDPEVWAQSCPSLGLQTTEADVAGEYDALKDTNLAGFRAQRLSIWPNARPLEDLARYFKAEDFAKCPPASDQLAPVVLGLEVSIDRSQAWLVAVGASVFGSPQVELVPTVLGGDVFEFDGTAGLAERIAEVVLANRDVAGLAVDSFGEAVGLLPSIAKAVQDADGWKGSLRKFETWALNGPQWVRAGGMLRDGITQHSIGHGAADEGGRIVSPTLAAAARDIDGVARDGVFVFKRHLSGPKAGPMFAVLPALFARQLASKPRTRAEIF